MTIFHQFEPASILIRHKYWGQQRAESLETELRKVWRGSSNAIRWSGLRIRNHPRVPRHSLLSRCCHQENKYRTFHPQPATLPISWTSAWQYYSRLSLLSSQIGTKRAMTGFIPRFSQVMLATSVPRRGGLSCHTPCVRTYALRGASHRIGEQLLRFLFQIG